MHVVKLDLNFSSFPSHITTLYRGGGEIVYRDKKQGVPRVLAAIVGFYASSNKMPRFKYLYLNKDIAMSSVLRNGQWRM